MHVPPAQDRTGSPPADAGGRGRTRPAAVPGPLAGLIAAMDRTLLELAGEGGNRDDMHALRNHLSDLCVLTEETPRMLRAVDRLILAGDRLGEAVLRPRGRDWRAPRLVRARAALAALERTLSGARPSRIAMRLNRDW